MAKIAYPRVTMALSINKQRFVAALLAQRTYNQTAAYESVFSARGQNASTGASGLMQDPEVRAAVEAGQTARLKKLELTAEDVLRDVALGVTSDGSELSDHVLDCCRHCYGHLHRYQFTPAEYERDLAAYLETKRGMDDPLGLKFNMKGGIGFDPRKPPVDDCTECHGRGVPAILFKDTRYLSEAGRRQYSGVKMTKHGPEVLVRSRDKALEIAAKHTGVAKENIKLETVRDLTEQQLDDKIAEAEARLKGKAP